MLACLAQASAEEDILFGRNAAGQLQVRIEFTQPFHVPASVFPGFPGYATGEMGFHSTILDEPQNDFFQLSTAADFRFVLLDKTTNMEVFNGSAFMTNGESAFVGPPPFDVHPFWNLLSWTPGARYSLTLKLTDLNGIYPDSSPFTINFVPVPAPGPFRLELRANGSNVTLTWPTNALGWALETDPEPGPAGNWVLVTNTPATTNENYSLNLPPAANRQFFRLRQQ